MSKKHKKQFYQNFNAQGQVQVSPHQAEYSIIKMDLVKVAILNAVYLVVILSLYFVNQKSHFLDNLFAKFLSF